jgi:hypothetical protein
MSINLYELTYEEFLNFGRAWSPGWTVSRQGFGWTLVFAPPGLTEIPSEAVYYRLLARRVEWHIADWMEHYVSEMAVKDRDDSRQIYTTTIRWIGQRVPTELATPITPKQNTREIAIILCNQLRHEFPERVFPDGAVSFPVPLLGREESADFAACIQNEMTLQGWLTEAFDQV